MSIEGTLDLFKLPEILQMVSQQTKTGILTVQGEQDIVAISFLRGRIVAADALSQTLEDGLGDVLVRDGLVSAEEIERASAELAASGGRLIDLLVERGSVTRAALLQALRVETLALLRRLLRWQQGDFKFYSGDEVSFEEGFVPIGVEDLLLDSLGDFADEEPLERTRSGRREVLGSTSPGLPSFPAIPDLPDILPPPSPSQRAAAKPAGPRPSAVDPGIGPAAGPGSGSNAVPIGPVFPAEAPAPVSSPAEGTAPVAEPRGLPGKFRQMTVERNEEGGVSAGARRSGRLAGLVLATLVLLGVATRPEAFLFPFPWQGALREERVGEQRQALYDKIDRANETFFLLEGAFPERLSHLAGKGLLSPADLRDPQGFALRFQPQEERFDLAAVDGGRVVPDSEHAGAIDGNFLLDPSFFTADSPTSAPLVLLD
jgi:hypothetical protein